MGGEGTMSHANSSLKYNRGLLIKKNPFKKEWGPRVDVSNTRVNEPREDTARKQNRKADRASSPVIDTGPDRANRFAAFMVILAALVIAVYCAFEF